MMQPLLSIGLVKPALGISEGVSATTAAGAIAAATAASALMVSNAVRLEIRASIHSKDQRESRLGKNP